MNPITPFLWFDGTAEDAMNLYVSIFKNSKVISVSRMGGANGKGAVMSAQFQIEGQNVIAFNGGPRFKFNESISMFVNVESQQELDRLWDKLAEGWQVQKCGWLKDKFGLSWQIIPSILPKLLQDPDAARSRRAMEAMMGMDKLDIAVLKQAADGTVGVAT